MIILRALFLATVVLAGALAAQNQQVQAKFDSAGFDMTLNNFPGGAGSYGSGTVKPYSGGTFNVTWVRIGPDVFIIPEGSNDWSIHLVDCPDPWGFNRGDALLNVTPGPDLGLWNYGPP